MTFYADPASFVSEVLSKYLAIPPVMKCSDWADKYRKVTKGPEKGQWRTSRTPFAREPMDCTDPEHPAQKVVLMCATQLMKTEVLYNSIFKRIHLSPMDMMMVQPTLQDAKDHSSQRFTQTAKSMPQVIRRIAETRSRDETNTLFTKEIADGSATIYFAGANSARSLASKPLGFVACDEIDCYPLDVDGAGDPLGLVWERMSNFPRRKLLLCSTPTLRGYSRIEAEYLASDRRRYWVPCPHCAQTQVLEWGATTEWGVKWLKTTSGEARAETAVYVCKHCGAGIEEHHKTQMLADGAWIPDSPGAQRGLVAGFHMSKLYSPLGWKSWAMLVEDWVKAREAQAMGDTSRLKTFINTSLAETWEEQGDRANEHELRRRAADIPLRLVQPGHYVMTLFVDVQRDRLHLGLWAWGRGMSRQLVDRAVIDGDPALDEAEPGSPWSRLTDYIRTPVENTYGRQVPLLCTLIDSGDNTQAVYWYCRNHRTDSVMATKGQSQPGKPIIGRPSVVEINWRGVKAKRGVKVWPIGADTAKGEFYGRLRVHHPGPGFVLLSKHMPPDSFEQLTSERVVTKYVKGHPKQEWILPPGRRNEDLDCAAGALAGAIWAGLDKWQSADWAKAEKRVQPIIEQPAAQKEQESAAKSAKPPSRRIRGRMMIANQ